MEKIDIVQHISSIGSVIDIGYSTGSTANSGVFEIIIVAINIICFFHTYSTGSDKKVAIRYTIITIAKTEHGVLIIHTGIISDYIFATFIRNGFAVAHAGVIKIAKLNCSSGYVSGGSAIAYSDTFIAIITAQTGHVLERTITDFMISRHCGTWVNVNQIADWSTSGFILEITI